MKVFLSLLLISVQLFSNAVEKLSINKQLYTIVKEAYDEYGDKGEIMRFYKGNEENKSALLLTFTLFNQTGACSARELQKGSYEINGKNLTLYTLWKRQGNAEEAPYGARIQLYKILENSSLKKVSSRLYIETTIRDYDKNSGMQYLFQEAKTEEEKKKLQEYIEEVEENYEGTFVFAKERKKLMKEVRKALRRKTKAQWKK